MGDFRNAVRILCFSDFTLPKILDKTHKRWYTDIVYSQLSSSLKLYNITEVIVE